ncbi:hypothetical protein, partial [Acinetobacter baumannii]|uniref:hypothetical protein n=1 Tax=Acinetobacter baumannii TaxID=470 RepID=UPI0021C6F3F1
LSDSELCVGWSSNVVLTQAGLDLVNSGADLPAFTLTPNDGIADGTAATVDPAVTQSTMHRPLP